MSQSILSDLRAAMGDARAQHASDADWLAQGPCEGWYHTYTRRELELAEHASRLRLEACESDLATYLRCAVEPSHCGLHFERCPYRRAWICYCNDCIDGDCVGDPPRYVATYVTGVGATEAEALEDYLDRTDA